MKNALLIAFSCIVLQAQAQHIDLSLNGGLIATNQTGDLVSPATVSKPGNSYNYGFKAGYVFRNGVITGVSFNVARLYFRQTMPFEPMIYQAYYNLPKVYIGTPSVFTKAFFGYRLSLKHAALSAMADVGYMSNSNFNKKSQYFYFSKLYASDSKSYCYGADVEYQHDIVQRLSVGLLGGIMFTSVPIIYDRPNTHLLCLNTALTVHYSF